MGTPMAFINQDSQVYHTAPTPKSGVHDVLEADALCALGAHAAGRQQRKAQLHAEHQVAAGCGAEEMDVMSTCHASLCT